MEFLLYAGLLLLFIFLFCREVRLDSKRYRNEKQSANTHVLDEIDRFLAHHKAKPDTQCGD